jgi:hypothetical protein
MWGLNTRQNRVSNKNTEVRTVSTFSSAAMMPTSIQRTIPCRLILAGVSDHNGHPDRYMNIGAAQVMGRTTMIVLIHQQIHLLISGGRSD